MSDTYKSEQRPGLFRRIWRVIAPPAGGVFPGGLVVAGVVAGGMFWGGVPPPPRHWFHPFRR